MYKPVIYLGAGIKRSQTLINYLIHLNIPVLTSWAAVDLISEDHPAFCGRPGIFGQRAANIIQQKASHLFIFGVRLDDTAVCYSFDQFAPGAVKVVYDVDQAELDKLPDHWHKIRVDLSRFDLVGSAPLLEILLRETRQDQALRDWLKWCKALYTRFRDELEGIEDCGYVDPFHFISALSDYARPNDVLAVGSSGSAPNTFLQAFKVKAGQIVTIAGVAGAMGADVPMAIGACIAAGRRTLCITGDGGFLLNVQELEMVRRYKLPIQFFIYNNNGYQSIRAMQDLRFNGRHVACDPASGLTLTSLADIADCYGLSYQCVNSLNGRYDYHAQIVELIIDPAWVQYPRVASRVVNGKSCPDRMEDMTPKLLESELKEIMRQ